MRHHRLLLATAALALLSASAHAVVPVSNEGQLPNLKVWDEFDHQTTLTQAIQSAGSGPVVVLPIYARCTMSCPITTNMLVGEAARMTSAKPYRVVIFSFDPTDDASALRHFRADKHLPPAWLLLRSDPTGVRLFCDFFHFPILTEGPVMIHNNQFFLLDHKLQWRATFIDKDWNATQLQTWLTRVESPTLLGWLQSNPESLARIGFGGLLLSLAAILAATLTRPTT